MKIWNSSIIGKILNSIDVPQMLLDLLHDVYHSVRHNYIGCPEDYVNGICTT